MRGRTKRGRAIAAPAPYKAPPPTLTLRGKHAHKLFKGRIGERVATRIHGRIISMGVDQHHDGHDGNRDRRNVTLEIHRTSEG